MWVIEGDENSNGTVFDTTVLVWSGWVMVKLRLSASSAIYLLYRCKS